MRDPYIWLENLKDPKVTNWFLARNKHARKFLKPTSDMLKPRIESYCSIPYALLVRTSKIGNFILLRDGEAFKIRLMYPDSHLSELIDSKNLEKTRFCNGSMFQWKETDLHFHTQLEAQTKES